MKRNLGKDFGNEKILGNFTGLNRLAIRKIAYSIFIFTVTHS